MEKNQAYAALEKQFESEYAEKNSTVDVYDEEFLKNAIRIFCVEAGIKASGSSVSCADKAAYIVALNLIRSPNLRKENRISLPNAWAEKLLTPAEQRRRTIAFEIIQDNQAAGSTISDSITRISKKKNVSFETARKAYYENQAMRDMMAKRKVEEDMRNEDSKN